MKKSTLLIILLTLVNISFAQLQFTSVNEVIVYADQHNLSLQKAEANKNIVAVNSGMAKSELSPKINAFSTAGYDPIIPTQVIPDKIFGGTEGKFTKVQFGMPYNFSTGLELSIPLLNFEKWAALQTSRLQIEKAKWTTETAKEALHDRVIETYYKSLAFRGLMATNSENEKVAKQLLAIIEKRKAQGITNPADLNRTKNLVIDIQSTGLEYERNHHLYLNELKSLLNLPQEASLVLKDSLSVNWELAALKETGAKALSKETASAYEVALQQLQESRKASLPKLSLQSRYYHQWLMNNGSNAQTVHFDAATVGLRMDVSLFNGGYNKARQKRAAYYVEEAAINKQQVQSNLAKQQADWLVAFQQAKKRWALVQQKLIVAGDNLRIAQLSMKEGIMEFEEFNNIFSEHIKAGIEKIQTQLDGLLYKTLLTQ
ncbi:MAG TPA: TolC family protein [Chitinophagaceae bacterium]|nr:TolC family protein [Chitinophagaceae bacterium]